MQLTRTADQITASNLGFELTDAEVATLGAGKRPPVVLAVNGRWTSRPWVPRGTP